MATSCQELLGDQEAWHEATEHRFLLSLCDGSIKPAQFETWLVQDYLFARDFARFLGALLARAPAEHVDAVIDGLAALRDELRWFEELCAERGLDTRSPPLPTCRRYHNLLAATAKQPSYAVHAVAFWAIERAYHCAWSSHMPMPMYQLYAERWGSRKFGEYVSELERQADDALSAATDEERDEAVDVFRQLCNLEHEFWGMALDAGGDDGNGDGGGSRSAGSAGGSGGAGASGGASAAELEEEHE